MRFVALLLVVGVTNACGEAGEPPPAGLDATLEGDAAAADAGLSDVGEVAADAGESTDAGSVEDAASNVADSGTLDAGSGSFDTGEASDTGVARPDAGVVRPDTGVVRPDTGVVRPDTGVIRRDTGVIRRDTGLIRRDTGVVRRDTGPQQDNFACMLYTVVRQRCLNCHRNNGRGGLGLGDGSNASIRNALMGNSSVGVPYLTPGNADRSYAYLRLAGRGDEIRGGSSAVMPPRSPLPPATVNAVRDWINRGAPDARCP